MSNRTDTALKRAIQKGWDKPSEAPSFSLENIHAELIAFVRRAQAKAWDEGMRARVIGTGHDENPYRGRKK